MRVLGSIALILMFSFSGWSQAGLETERASIRVIDTGTAAATLMTNIDGGPVVGEMLNAHFFPGVKDFNQGRYGFALGQFDYVLNRPNYLNGNPRQAEYISTAYYLRGMIFRYHADGLGRFTFAREDFEAAIKANDNNHFAHLELSRLYATLGLMEPALAILHNLEKRTLEDDVAAAVAADLKALTAPPADAAPATAAAAKPGAGAKPVAPVPVAPPRMGSIAINSRVAVDVYVDGKQVGSTPLVIQLPEGARTLEYRHEDLTKSVTHTIKGDERITETVAFDVTVDINANPWAEVSIEGTSEVLGQTPLAAVRVPYGASLVFRNPAFPEQRHKVLNTDRSITVSFR